jgi:XTP/dITP diphosphohydrolase
MQTLLIGTANPEKVREIQAGLIGTPCTLNTLADLDLSVSDVEECGLTLEENAVLKARTYAQASGLLTLADDTGLFIDALDGWPGVKSARAFKGTSIQDDPEILDALCAVPDNNSGAEFRTAIAIHDPRNDTTFVSRGELRGEIRPGHAQHADVTWGYTSVFYVPSESKTYGQMTVSEKNAVSQRGKALREISHFLRKNYGAQTLVVAIGIIIQEGKVLMTKRNDPHRPDFHEAWEFPGGGVECGETVEQALVREVREETGFDVDILHRPSLIHTVARVAKSWEYQVHVIPYICTVRSGTLSVEDSGVIDHQWFTPESIGNQRMYSGNRGLIEKLMPDINVYA